MRPSNKLKILNPILAIALLTQVGTGASMYFLGADIERVHVTNGAVLVLLWLGHISLNWGWVRRTYGRGKRP